MVYFSTSFNMFLQYLAKLTNTKIEFFHSTSYDYGRSVKNGRCWTFLRWTWGKSQQQVLPGSSSIASNVACYQICCGWQFCFSVGQRTERRFASAVYAVALCLSVCLSVGSSVTGRCSTVTAEHRIKQTTLRHSSENLVLCCQRSRRNSDGITSKGRQMQVG